MFMRPILLASSQVTTKYFVTVKAVTSEVLWVLTPPPAEKV